MKHIVKKYFRDAVVTNIEAENLSQKESNLL